MLKKIIFIFSISTVCLLNAQIKCPSFFSDKMVLQRASNAPIWGWAKPNEKISISTSWGAGSTAQADGHGEWKLFIETPKAGGPHTINIKGNNSQLTFKNVMIGDIWLCVGQSNMDAKMKRYSTEVPAQAQKSKVRLFKAPMVSAYEDQKDINSKWTDSDANNLGHFSAVGYYFGREIEKETNIPIGLIQASWGSKFIEYFIPWEYQKKQKYLQKNRQMALEQAKTYDRAKEEKVYDTAYAKWEADKEVWIKEGKQGEFRNKPKFKVHPITESASFASSVYSGMIHPFVGIQMKGVIWYQGEANSKKAHGEGWGDHYEEMIITLIKSWRKEWGIGDFPFYIVQLPNCWQAWNEPIELKEAWPYTRYGMLQASLKLPKVEIAVAEGLGEAKNVHPKKKKEVGQRLALLALRHDYRKNIPWSGPLAKSCVFNVKDAVVTFENGGSDLVAKDGLPLKGFAVIDQNGEIQEAKAKIISKDKIMIHSTNDKPFNAVYYAWANNAVGANLENKAGLPASVFKFER